ncbi:MAG: TonB-dependent receptor [bacterium]|nr:TonB-dependent receptor [bacterium]
MKLKYHLQIATVIAMLICNTLIAQSVLTDTIYAFKGVVINSNRLNHFSAGSKINSFDSLTLSQHRFRNLGDLLSEESALFVKSYGLNSLASASFRGGSASQTAVLWNGFNINSPMNGQIDLSLIPVNFCDAVSIQYGGSSALWGSGAMGGAVHLNNLASYNKGVNIKLNLSGGSFGSFSKQAAFQISRKRFISSIKIFQSNAKNDFQYKNIYSGEKTKSTQSNAEITTQGFLNENHFLISKNQSINLMLWVQQTDRNLPPTMLQKSSVSKQKDESIRLTSEWRLQKNKINTSVRAAYFDEALQYEDQTIKSNNRSRTFISESETKIAFNKQHTLNLGINNTYATALADGYTNNPSLNRLAFFAAYGFTNLNGKLISTLSLRKEFISHRNVPLVYSIGTNYKLNKNIKLKANASRVYRLPTFNDWFWNPGGNPNLLHENGFTQDLGVMFQAKSNTSRWQYTSEYTAFNKQINNWIIWLPNGNYWHPENIMKVWSRGIETNSTFALKLHKIKFSFSVLTNYVVSTNQNTISNEDASLNKQLIYVPMYSGHAKLNIEYKKFNATYKHSYTGYRYTSSDNTEYLAPFQLGAVYCSYKMHYKKWQTAAFFQINNVWNTEYQIMQNRAMPLRNFAVGLSLEINQK